MMLCQPFLLFLIVSLGIQSISAAAPTPLTQAQKLAWLNDHNVVRCQANAQTMPALIWDDALEKTAQEYANTCPSGHNANRQTRFVYFSGLSNVQGVGENYAAGYQTAIDVDGGWASEKPSMGGHYTQMVWAGTTRVGCALNTVSCGGYGTYWLCDYYPPGNYIGQQPFVAGGGSNTEACQQQSRTDFPVMVYNNGVGTVVNGINGLPGAPTIGPSTQGPATQAPATNPPVTTTRPPTTSRPTTAPTTAPTSAPTTAPTTAPTSAPTSSPTSGPTSYPSNPTSGPTNSGGSLYPGTPSSSPTSPVDPASQLGDSSNSGSTRGNNMGMMVGIVVGVVVGIIVLALVAYYIYHRRSSITWMTSKTHMTDIQGNMDANRYYRGKGKNQFSPEPSRAPAPLTSITTTTTPATTTYNPGQVFNPPSFATNTHRKQDSMDNYQINPVVAQGTPVINKPVIPASPPMIPTSRPQASSPPVIPSSRPQASSPPVPMSRPQMSPTKMNRQLGGDPPPHRFVGGQAW